MPKAVTKLLCVTLCVTRSTWENYAPVRRRAIDLEHIGCAWIYGWNFVNLEVRFSMFNFEWLTCWLVVTRERTRPSERASGLRTGTRTY